MRLSRRRQSYFTVIQSVRFLSTGGGLSFFNLNQQRSRPKFTPHNGLGLTPAAAVRLARRHARPINALGDDQPTLSALYYDMYEFIYYDYNVFTNIQNSNGSWFLRALRLCLECPGKDNIYSIALTKIFIALAATNISETELSSFLALRMQVRRLRSTAEQNPNHTVYRTTVE